MTFQEQVSAITPAQGKAFLAGLAPDLHINMRDPLCCLGSRLIKHVTGTSVFVGHDAGAVWETGERFTTPAWLARTIKTALDAGNRLSRYAPATLLDLIDTQPDSGTLLQVTVLPAPVAALAVL